VRAPTRHPRLAAAACKVYGLTILLYPQAFRRAFGRELTITFRNRVEDVLDGGDVHDWLAFAAHIAVDTTRACADVLTAAGGPEPVSLLGLTDGDIAHGSLDRAYVDILQRIFVLAGLALTIGGWYAFLAILPSYHG
jgi:hypothetical protein